MQRRPERPRRDGLQRRSWALAVTLASMVLTLLALVSFASALEVWTADRTTGCVDAEVVVECDPASIGRDARRGTVLLATAAVLQISTHRRHRRDEQGPGPASP